MATQNIYGASPREITNERDFTQLYKVINSYKYIYFNRLKKPTGMNQCNDIWSDNKFDATVSGFTRSPTTITTIFTDDRIHKYFGTDRDSWDEGLKSKKLYKLKVLQAQFECSF